MGMSVGSGGPHAVKNDINVTPLVDIVLVLLIIFLVTLPIMLEKHKVTVPKELQANQVQRNQNDIITIVGCPGGQITLEQGGKKTDLTLMGLRTDLPQMLNEIPEDRRTIFFDFGDDVIYGDAMTIMDTIVGAGRKPGADVSTVKLAMRKRPKDEAGTVEIPCESMTP